MKLYLVGGAVRDQMLGFTPHDYDFSVEVGSFGELRDGLLERGFEIFLETPEYDTIRARFPRDDPQHPGVAADFVRCDDIIEDLARRDFTVNAVAIDEDGSVIDPHSGTVDATLGELRFVGSAYDRLAEDGLRILRMLRFHITRGLKMVDTEPLWSPRVAGWLYGASIERVRNEVHAMFTHDTEKSLSLIASLPPAMRVAIFRGNELKMLPTLGRKL